MQINEETAYNIIDKAMVDKAIMQAQVACKKCGVFSEQAQDLKTKNYFLTQEKLLNKTVEDLQQLSSKLS